MELTASNIATCTIATTRCAAGGVMRGVTKAMAFSFQSAITSANAEGAGVISATATSTLRRLACMPCPLLFVERWRPRMTAATARTVASARRSSRFDLLRRHANAAASGVMSGTHATRRCAYLVPDLYRPPERARINCLCRGLRVAIGKGYKRKVPSNGSDARLIRTVTRRGGPAQNAGFLMSALPQSRIWTCQAACSYREPHRRKRNGGGDERLRSVLPGRQGR